MMEVQPVADRVGLREFIRLPHRLYPMDSPWVPPLDVAVRDYLSPKKNPFFADGWGQAFLAKIDGAVVGRILVHVWRRHHRLHAEPAAYFGFFESIDDGEVAAGLLGAAKKFTMQHGCSVLRGPINMTLAQEMGLLVEGFESAPSIDMVYTAPYYQRLLSGAGFRAVCPVSTWKNSTLETTAVPSLKPELSAGLSALGVSFRTLRYWRREADMEQIRRVVNSAFLGNYGFVPITREEWRLQLGPLLPLMDPAIVQIAEVQGTMVGVSLVVPDFNPVLRRAKGKMFHPAMLRLLWPRPLADATVILFAVRKQFQGLGLSRQLNANLVTALRLRGYRSLSITWIADDNRPSLAQARALGMSRLHRVALFEVTLS